jgi:YebC/PmpR family DNA-binding regulatory protein
MAGHSQFKNIMHRKGAQDKKRAKLFTRIARELIVAAKEGDDPNFNPRLRTAIAEARAANMPKNKIEGAIKSASNASENGNFEEMFYEGYGSGGVAIIVHALTDNKNRTSSAVRSAFNKYGGNLGESGSVSYLFKRVGLLVFPIKTATATQMLDTAIEVGADDCQSTESEHEITCQPHDFHSVREALVAKYGEPDRAVLSWLPLSAIELTEENAASVIKLIDALEECDDVQEVFGNFSVSDSLMKKLGL